jgi:hypothetical protein
LKPRLLTWNKPSSWRADLVYMKLESLKDIILGYIVTSLLN